MLANLDDSISPKHLLALFTKMAMMSRPEAHEFQQQLNQPARIYSFDYGDLVETVGDLEVYDATANADKTYFNGSYLSEKKITLPASFVKQKDGIFEFIIQGLGGKECHLITCHLTRKNQGKGQSKDMIKSIKELCFNHLKYDKIYARAARPKVDQGVLGTEDWRETIVEYKGKQMTALMRFWLRQKNVFPLTDFEAGASNDRFVIIPNEDL